MTELQLFEFDAILKLKFKAKSRAIFSYASFINNNYRIDHYSIAVFIRLALMRQTG